VLSLVVTAGQRGDSPQFQTVLDGINVPRIGAGRPRTRPDKVRADKSYSSRANRAYLRRRGIACTIPEPADQQQHRKNRGRRGGRPPRFSPDDYEPGTPSNAESTDSNATAPSPPDTTNSPSGTKPSSTSSSSTTGS